MSLHHIKSFYGAICCIALFLCSSFSLKGQLRDTLDLAGEWYYLLHQAPIEVICEGNLTLPGTLDSNHKGIPVPPGEHTSQLSRRFNYAGNASYIKEIEIPWQWAGKDIELLIERTRPTTIKIDGEKIGSNKRLSSPHRYNLSQYLTPGRHELEIIVNNYDSIPGSIRRNSHVSSEATQTNWNGMLGQILLEAKNPLNIDNIILLPDYEKMEFLAIMTLSEEAPADMALRYSIDGFDPSWQEIRKGEQVIEFSIPALPLNPEWSEWTPQTQNFTFTLLSDTGNEIDTRQLRSGLRDFSTAGNNFFINGKKTFLRGTVNAAVFPLTGFAPMDEKAWKDYFSKVKEYGLNHVRFHSWCPPEAAFVAADELGIYLQLELPLWGEIDRDLKEKTVFLKDDMQGILEEYSSHPSFVLFSIGNELWGDISLMKEFVDEAKEYNPSLLTTYGSNVYLGINGYMDDEDFMVATRTGDDDKGDTRVRGSFSFADAKDGGYFNSTYPESESDYSMQTAFSPVPVISHEVGQYQTYPDFNQTKKYTGVLRPDNFDEFRRRAVEAGTFRKASGFADASAKWAATLYKAEAEKTLRTPSMGGFQLMGLQDYPGQGTALVGLLDAFMDSKGGVSANEWRNSCSDYAILAEFPQFCFFETEELAIPVKIANYSASAENPTVKWSSGFDKGYLNAPSGRGVMDAGTIKMKLPKLKVPKKFTLSLEGNNGKSRNSYEFWVYPYKMKKAKDVHVTSNMEEALRLLSLGEKVLLCPKQKDVAMASLDGLFQTDFWNYRMFRTICDKMEVEPSPGTMGLFIDEKHPAFASFPTDNHTDWQWFPTVHNSYPLIIDRLPKDFDPIIEVIDNVERNFRLALLLECNVGKGKLMILAADMDKAALHPEGAWLLQSIKEYMASGDFKPKFTLTDEQVRNLLTVPSMQRKIRELKNEIYDSHWD